MMNHEKRIKNLESELAKLKKIMTAAGLYDDFVPISKASRLLGDSPWVIKDRIKRDPAIALNRHYRMNGNRYQVNIEQWRRLKAADSEAKRS